MRRVSWKRYRVVKNDSTASSYLHALLDIALREPQGPLCRILAFKLPSSGTVRAEGFRRKFQVSPVIKGAINFKEEAPPVRLSQLTFEMRGLDSATGSMRFLRILNFRRIRYMSELNDSLVFVGKLVPASTRTSLVAIPYPNALYLSQADI